MEKDDETGLLTSRRKKHGREREDGKKKNGS